MSLLWIVGHPHVRERLRALHPPVARPLTEPLRAPPRTRRYGLVGTAFDYLFRFEIQRRALKVRAEPWVAARAPHLLRRAERGEAGVRIIPPEGGSPMYVRPLGGFEPLADRAEQVILQAQFALADYVAKEAPSPAALKKLAKCALQLAKLDLVVRVGVLDTGTRVEKADVEDLLAMLDLAPFVQFPLERDVYLNPTFGQASMDVGGADADLIVGDVLLDIKATMKLRLDPNSLDQILGYFFLARRARRTDPTFPDIGRLALYYARHGELRLLPVEGWLQNPAFAETEAWFFEEAEYLLSEDELRGEMEDADGRHA